MAKKGKERADTVLYCRVGRAKELERPVLSLAADDPNHDAAIGAKQVEIINECNRAGSMSPVFRVEEGRAVDQDNGGA